MTTLTFFQCYLFGWAFWTSLTIGCVSLLVLHHAVRGSWGLPILRVLESGAKMLPIMLLLFLPILFQVWTKTGGNLYPWETPGNDPILLHKSQYLNPLWFTFRTLLYFAVWIGFSSALTNSELRQDTNRNERLGERRATIGAWGIVFVTLTVTFAWTDWVMSLDAHWFSTIFGAWFLLGGAMNAMAFATIYVTRRAVAGKQPWRDAVTWQFRKDAGSLLLMFAMVWAYFSLSQFLIIWSGNLPEENIYYVKRFSDPVFLGMGLLLILMQWLGPFIALLAPRTKRATGLLFGISCVIIVMRFIDVFWTIMPFFAEYNEQMKRIAPMPPEMVGLALLIGAAVGVLWLVVVTANMKRVAPLPTHDPRLQELMEASAHAS